MLSKEIKKLTTNEVAPDGMTPHGHVEMWFDGDFLRYGFIGPFNVELINALAKAQLAFLDREHRLRPWVSICTMSNSAVGSPEAFERYAAIMRAPKPPGYTPVATAFVIGPE